MRKLCGLIFVSAVFFVVCLAGCAGKHTDNGLKDNPTDPPAPARSIKPIAPAVPDDEPPQSATSNSPDTPSVDVSASEPIPSTTDDERSTPEIVPSEQEKVDIDLTGFSSNMLYAEVYNMGMTPEDYKGKIIKLTGEFAHFPKDVDENGNPTTDEEILVCIISDALACCATGVEFVPEKESSIWTHYPEDGSKITVTGLCDIFLDDSGWFTIIQLDNAKVEYVE